MKKGKNLFIFFYIEPNIALSLDKQNPPANHPSASPMPPLGEGPCGMETAAQLFPSHLLH